jgi:hypothetical protein
MLAHYMRITNEWALDNWESTVHSIVVRFFCLGRFDTQIILFPTDCLFPLNFDLLVHIPYC